MKPAVDFRRRSAWALGLSLVLHALIILLLVVAEDRRPPAPAPSQAIEITMLESEAPPKPKPPEPAPAPRPAASPSAKAAPKKAAAATAAAPGEAPSAQPPSAPASPAPAAGTHDAPKVVTLVPGSDFVVPGQGSADAEGPHGHTVVNGPGEEPDPVAMNEYLGEKLGRRTNSMVSGMIADARARNGLVDPYFMGARRALESDLCDGNVPLPKNSVVHEGIKGYLQTTENFGRTGNPFAPGTEPKWNDFSLARGESQGMAMQARDPEWAGIMRQAQQSMAAGEATKRVVDHAFLMAILELVQEPGGGIADAHIVKSSGYKDFDEYVLHRARKVFLKLDDPPEAGHGISSAGWRTLWKFSYFPASIADMRGQRVRVELLRVETGPGSGNPLEHEAQ